MGELENWRIGEFPTLQMVDRFIPAGHGFLGGGYCDFFTEPHWRKRGSFRQNRALEDVWGRCSANRVQFYETVMRPHRLAVTVTQLMCTDRYTAGVMNS